MSIRNTAFPVLALLLGFVVSGCSDEAAGPLEIVAPQQALVADGTLAANKVATGDFHACVITTNDTVTCWGRNNYGQTTVPAGLGNVVQIAAGSLHTCAIRTDNNLSCWGFGNYGQTTNPTGLGTVKRVATGGYHTCAVMASSTLDCWGYDSHGQTTIPAGLSTVKEVSAGAYHTCAIKTDDRVLCWGYNGYGETTIPSGLGRVKQVAAGSYHTCAIKIDDTLVCWGYNDYGQTTPPVGLGTVKKLATGGNHTCAIKTDDTLACWGQSSNGETTNPSGLGTVRQVAAGFYYTCAIRTDLSVACWGSNTYGQTSLPVRPVTPSSSTATVASTSSIEIEWTDASVNEANFIIRRRHKSGGVWGGYLVIEQPEADVITYLDTGLIGGDSYQYRVSACNAIGCSSYAESAIVTIPTAPPAAPSALTVRATSAPSIQLTWIHGSPGESHFEVRRRLRTGDVWGTYAEIARPAANATTYTDAAVTSGSRYQYKVLACNVAGCSGAAISSGIIAP